MAKGDLRGHRRSLVAGRAAARRHVPDHGLGYCGHAATHGYFFPDPQDTPAEQQRQRDAWITVQRGHAVANGLPVVAVNRVGTESAPVGTGAQRFWGSSFVAGPQGELLAQADSDKEETLVAAIDCARSERVRRIWRFLRDRRIDAYGDLTQRYLDG